MGWRNDKELKPKTTWTKLQDGENHLFFRDDGALEETKWGSKRVTFSINNDQKLGLTSKRLIDLLERKYKTLKNKWLCIEKKGTSYETTYTVRELTVEETGKLKDEIGYTTEMTK